MKLFPAKLLKALLLLPTCGLLISCTEPSNLEKNSITQPSELSGIFHKGEKTIVPDYLVLDGPNERCYLRLRGGFPRDLKSGAGIYVRGVLRSYLFEHSPASYAPPPFREFC